MYMRERIWDMPVVCVCMCVVYTRKMLLLYLNARCQFWFSAQITTLAREDNIIVSGNSDEIRLMIFLPLLRGIYDDVYSYKCKEDYTE